MIADDLPDGSIVADDAAAYIKGRASATAPWRGTNGGGFSDTHIQGWMNEGVLTLLRVGTQIDDGACRRERAGLIADRDHAADEAARAEIIAAAQNESGRAA